MRMERRSGQTGLQAAVEAEHQRQHGTFEPYYRIAAELYDTYPSRTKVAAEISRIYGVIVGKVAVSRWINRGLAERRDQISAT